MNTHDFDKLLNCIECREYVLNVYDLKNKSDRTLLYGTNNNYVWHVYLQKNHIYTVTYKLGEEPIEVTVNNNNKYIPDRLFPECCDFEFCKLLKEKSLYLDFNKYNFSETTKTYYGKTL